MDDTKLIAQLNLHLDFYLLYVYTPSRRQVTSPQTQMPSEAARQLKLTEHFDQSLLQSTIHDMLHAIESENNNGSSFIWHMGTKACD